MEFPEKIKYYQSLIENALYAYLPPPNTRPSSLHQAMLYSLHAGGKRIRPILTLLSSQIFSKKPNIPDPIIAAVAVECLHTYSLIHDDLPSMDNSPLRRGQPTCHIAFDESTAILAGDALLTYAFELISKQYKLHPQLGLTLIEELSTAAGHLKLIAGQIEDLLAENSSNNLSNVDIDFIHYSKTAAMIQSAVKIGFLHTDFPQDTLPLIESFGKYLGLSYQIIDDILDFTSTTEILGKQAKLDIINHKINYVVIKGLSVAKQQALEYTTECLKILENLPGDTHLLKSLVNQTLNRQF